VVTTSTSLHPFAGRGGPTLAGSTARRRHGWRAGLVLAVLVVGSQGAGLIGVPLTETSPGSWYDQLDKPAFTPPSWLFAPVWTTLYVLIGVAAWLVWRHRDSTRRDVALAIFAGQLVLNALWTPLFFGAELPTVALVDIALLLGAAVATFVAFLRVDRMAALLFAPYIGWVGFATVLNATIVAIN
jgi:benzodiazapine receptor